MRVIQDTVAQLLESDALTPNDAETLRPDWYIVEADNVEHLVVTIMSLAAKNCPDPPSGWYVFGTHAGWDHWDMPRLEFHSDLDEGGMPLWERPVRTLVAPVETPEGTKAGCVCGRVRPCGGPHDCAKM